MTQLYASPRLDQDIESLLKDLPAYLARTQGRNRRRTLTLELLQSSCNLNCRCKCHGSLQQDSHWLWTGLVGCLFNGYTAKPISSLVCNIKDCQSQSSKITFAFPTWFWYRALSVSTGLCYQPGPERCLTVTRVRPSEAEIANDRWRILFTLCNNDRKALLDLPIKYLSASAKSRNGNTPSRHLNDQNLSRNAGRAGAESSRAAQDLQGDTWIYVDPQWRQAERDEHDSKCYIKPHQTPILTQKDALLEYFPFLAKLFGPTIQYRFLRRRNLFNKLPSNIKYVIDLTPPGKDEGA